MDEKQFWVELQALSGKCVGLNCPGLGTLRQLNIAHLRDDPDRLKDMDNVCRAMEREYVGDSMSNSIEMPSCYDKNFFSRDPYIRGGSVCLRGTELTPSEVVAIESDSLLQDYPHIKPAHVEACRQVVSTLNLKSTRPVYQSYGNAVYFVRPPYVTIESVSTQWL